MLSWEYNHAALFVRLEPVFLDRHGILLCVLVQLIAMYLIGSLSGFIIPKVSPRVKTLPNRRQKQLAIAIPVILLKASIMVLITDTLISTASFPNARAASSAGPSMDYRFQTLYFIAISYIFEILQRPSSAELVAHHLYLQGLPFYYWFWLSNRAAAHVQLAMRFFELMVLLGPGATDIASDLTFVLYYSAPRSWTGLAATRVMSLVASIMRATQWIVLMAYGYSKYTDAIALLSLLEKDIFVVSVILWVWTEFDEIMKIRGMVRKFQSSLQKKGV